MARYLFIYTHIVLIKLHGHPVTSPAHLARTTGAVYCIGVANFLSFFPYLFIICYILSFYMCGEMMYGRRFDGIFVIVGGENFVRMGLVWCRLW